VVGGAERKRKTFPVPTQEMGAQTQNGDPYLLVLYWRVGEYRWSKLMGLGG
jgi:hypothetical protein